MVLLNGIAFPIYGIDTQESRLNRVALFLQTLPIFVSTQPPNLLEIDEKTNIIAENLLLLIKNDHQEEKMDFQQFYQQIEKRFAADFETILYAWLKQIPQFEFVKDPIIMDIESKYPNINVNTILNHKGYDQTDNIKIFLESQKQVEKDLENFQTVFPVRMDNIDVQKITFEVQFFISFDLVEMFDQLKLSLELPYANNGSDRHKIFKGFKNLGENWELGDNSAVQFYVLNTKYIPSKFQEKNYSQGVIVMAEQKGQAILAIETLIGAKNNLQDLITRVFTSLQVDQKQIIQTRQQSVSSLVNVPQQRFNKYIVNDLLVTDPLISNLCFVDESIKIGRVKSGITFFYQPVGSNDKVTIGFTEVNSDLKLYRKDAQMYPSESRYTKVRINKAKDELATREIAVFIGKIFAIYNKQKEKIVNEYTSLIPSFVELEEKDVRHIVRKTNRLQDLVPSIFIPGYARKCQRPPVIIDEKMPEVKDQFLVLNPTPEFKQALLFPKTAEEGPQHWYACEKGGYPGLRTNVLSNAGQYPYLPCCYPKPQEDKKNYKNYYFDLDIKDSSNVFSHILKTPKILDKGELGTIPGNLEKLFQSITNESTDFFRVGVSRTPSSFIEAVATALGRGVNKKGVTDAMLASCRQSAYSSSTENLKKEFNSNENYLNPNIYYRALEEYYRCNIYLFSRGENNLGKLIYPLHRYVFLRYRRDPLRPAVIILEHMGSESDAAQYPQCELIISVKGSLRSTNFTGDFADKLDQIFRKTVNYYAGEQIVTDIDPKVIPDNVIAQGIDSFGKTRTLVLKYKNKDLFLITNPLSPLVLPERLGYKNNDSGLVENYIYETKAELIEKTPDRYIVRKNGMTFSLPYAVKTGSILRVYNQNQRVARYLQEYAYFLYSRYAKENQMNPNNINDFLRNNTIVLERYDYPKIPRRFDLKSPYLTENKLIVHSLEMAQRLGFSIELLMQRDPRTLKEYCGYEWIQNYYLDKNDFTADPDAIIFMTDEALKDWIAEQNVEYPLLKVPDKDGLIYFLEVKGNIKLVQKAESFENAVYIASTWNRDKYNSRSVQIDDQSPYMYYQFESPEHIRIIGNSPNKVLVWREEEELYYGAILD